MNRNVLIGAAVVLVLLYMFGPRFGFALPSFGGDDDDWGGANYNRAYKHSHYNDNSDGDWRPFNPFR